MSSGGGVVYGAGNGLSLMWGNVHATFEVQMTIGHVPVIFGQVREQGGAKFQGFEGSKY